jgi:putative DNA-invertase from lambdoid prophage Rac
MRAALYARVSTYDQQTLSLQIASMQEYVKQRGWVITKEIQEIGSGAKKRPQRDELLKLARKREIDVIIVWKLDRWGRSLHDLILCFEELNALNVGFISITEAIDMTTPSGRALAAMLAVFASFERDVLRDRVKAGIAHAKRLGKPHGRPVTTANHLQEIRSLFNKGVSKSQIAKKLGISRTSVTKWLNHNHQS